MKSSIKLLISDIDGTLIDPSEAITSDFAVLDHILEQKGINFVLASGRCLSESQKFIDALPRISGAVINNGAGGRLNGSALWDEFFPAYTVHDAIEEADRLGVTILMSSGDDIQCYKITPYIENEIKTFGRFNHFYIPLKKEWETVRFQRVSIIDQERPGRIDQLLPLLEPYEHELEICRYDTRHVDIVKSGCTKGGGVLRLIREMGINPENVLAVGDGANDVEMLQSVGIGVAVGNAAESAKQAAKAVMEQNRLKGVIEAVERFC